MTLPNVRKKKREVWIFGNGLRRLWNPAGASWEGERPPDRADIGKANLLVASDRAPVGGCHVEGNAAHPTCKRPPNHLAQHLGPDPLVALVGVHADREGTNL